MAAWIPPCRMPAALSASSRTTHCMEMLPRSTARIVPLSQRVNGGARWGSSFWMYPRSCSRRLMHRPRSTGDLLDQIGCDAAVDSQRLGHFDDELPLAGADDAVSGEHADGHGEGEAARSLVPQPRLERDQGPV